MESFVSSQKKYSAALAEVVKSITTDEMTENGNSGKRKRAPKAPKDPDAPKRPASSYLLFQNEIWAELKEKHPEMKANDLRKHTAELWGKMSDADKKVRFPRDRLWVSIFSPQLTRTQFRNGVHTQTCSRRSML